MEGGAETERGEGERERENQQLCLKIYLSIYLCVCLHEFMVQHMHAAGRPQGAGFPGIGGADSCVLPGAGNQARVLDKSSGCS